MTASLVLDASVAAAWLLPDEKTNATRRAYVRLREEAVQAQAPMLWLWECTNIIANAVKRRRLTGADAMLTWSVLDVVRARVMLVELLPEHLRECLGLANEQGLSIYDASYLWLARLHDVQLLTHDARLAEAAGRVGVSVITAEQLT